MLFPSLSGGRSASSSSILSSLLLITSLGARYASAGDVLRTNGFSTCLASDSMTVDRMNVEYDRTTRNIVFDVAGTSKKEQNIHMVMTVTVYGKEFYKREFDPCDEGIKQLCPVPAGSFAAKDSMNVPEEFASQIPAIAFQIPDLDGIVKLKLLQKEDNAELACLSSVVDNGKTASVPQAKYVTAVMAAGALVVTGVSAAASGGAGPSPGFVEVMFWFQGIAMDGMLSVGYPKVYRAFTDNFAWSTGLISWEGMQRSIDGFRSKTGGNLDHMSIDYLLNATLVYTADIEDSAATNATSKVRRSAIPELGELFERDLEIPNVSINGSNADADSGVTQQSSEMRFVKGVQAKAEELKIPSANTFMTVLLIFCIVLAAIAVCILLFKVILELWALFGNFPKGLTGFRKRYWSFLMTTIVRIILILYGTWTLYCLYQFKNGDSWGAHVLAGVTLAIFSAILGFFAFRIFSAAREAKKSANGQEQLFLHKPYLRKYGLFYEQYKTNFWWIFFPLIIYAFAKGAFIALGDGHGLIQTVGQLACEAGLLVLLLWSRPYNTKAGNVLNIIISCVRVLSVGCLIVFVDQLGVAATTKTVTGLALIIIQSVLTAALAICLIVNAIVVMCKKNPHKVRRKELEKQRLAAEGNDLGPLDSRISMVSHHRGGSDGKGFYQVAPTAAAGGFQDPQQQGPGGYPLHHMTPHAPEQMMGHHRDGSTASRTAGYGAYEDYRHQGLAGGETQYPPNSGMGVARGY